MDVTVADAPERGRFEISVDGELVGFATYHVDGDVMTLPHTEVDPSLGGLGLGTQLVRGALAGARERGLRVLPYCTFTRHYLHEHPAELDLVADADRARFGLATADH